MPGRLFSSSDQGIFQNPKTYALSAGLPRHAGLQCGLGGSPRMPARYVIDKQRRLVISTAWGHLTFAESRAHQDQLARDPDFSPTFDQLLDATAITTIELSAQE